MSKRNGFPMKMRPLVIKDLPETVQIAIKKRAWRDDVSYERAAADMLHDAEIERIIERDLTVRRKLQEFEDQEQF